MVMPRRGMGVEIVYEIMVLHPLPVMPRRGMGVEIASIIMLYKTAYASCPARGMGVEIVQ